MDTVLQPLCINPPAIVKALQGEALFINVMISQEVDTLRQIPGITVSQFGLYYTANEIKLSDNRIYTYL